MNEPMEDRLRNMLSATALREVPDSTSIPPRRRGDGLGRVRARRVRPWLAPAVAAVAAAVLAITATLFFVRRDGPIAAHPAIVIQTAPSRPSDPVSVVPVAPGVRTSAPRTRTIAVTIPDDLIGKSYDQAAKELAELGLKPVKQIVDSTSPVNQVLAVSGPKAGQSAMSVNVRVANNRLFVVPNLANETPEGAVAQLQALGWKGNLESLDQLSTRTTDRSLVGLISGRADNTVGPVDDSGFPVPAQAPAAGATVNKAVGITVVVYSKKQIPMPAFRPQVTLLVNIQEQLTRAGFSDVTYHIVTPAVPPNVPHTFISLTGATSGDVVDFDTPVTITVWGDAPPPATPTTPTTASGG